VSFLEPADRRGLESAMQWAELTEADLDFPRDYVNYGSKDSPDRWRLPSAHRALTEAMSLPAIAAGTARLLTADLGARSGAPSWEGFFRVVGDELSTSDADPCANPDALRTDLGLLDQIAGFDRDRGERWSKRELRDMKSRLDPRVDGAVGRLMDEAAVAVCRVEAVFKGLPKDSIPALLDVLDAMLRGGDEDPDTEEEGFRRFEILTTAWDATDRSGLLLAGHAWSTAIAEAAIDLSLVPAEGWPPNPMILTSALGEIWIGSMGNNSGSGDPTLLIDPGGDDRWRIASSRDRLSDAPTLRVRGWIDLGGDDAWLGGDVGPGGALLGLSAGIDLAGDDLHRSGRLTQGAAAFGVATWLDLAGDDRYDGAVATQGFALAGGAILRDLAGGDLYRADGWAQGSAQFQGIAVLHEAGGNDHYILAAVHEDNPNRLPGYFSGYGQGFAIGLRPYAGGGVAWLLDESGHDRYTGGLWVQGSSYWHSVAALIDRSGNDLYTSVQYSQRSARHLSSAGLFDGGGHDRYLTTTLGQGSGHDLAVSWLIDADGNDAYHGRSTVQGTSLTNAISFFIDRAGDDTYSSRSDRWTGAAVPARNWGSIALFVDGDGADAYLGRTPPRNGTVTPRFGYGAAADLGVEVADGGGDGEVPWSSGRPARVADGPPPKNAEQAQTILLADVVWTAPGERTDAAVDRVFRAGSKAVAWVLPLVSDKRLLQSYTVDALVRRWAKEGRSADRSRIAKAIAQSALDWPRGHDVVDVRRHLAWLGILAEAEPTTVGEASRAAEAFLAHESFILRVSAHDLLARIAAIDGLEIEEAIVEKWAQSGALGVQTDPTPQGRAAAARLLIPVGGTGTASILAEALLTGSFAVRGAAEDALIAIAGRTDGIAVARGVFPLTDRGSRRTAPVRAAALRVLGATKHLDALEVFQEAVADPDPVIRAAAVDGAARLEDRKADALLAERLAEESDVRVRTHLDAWVALREAEAN
jgi:hypothetical protein